LLLLCGTSGVARADVGPALELLRSGEVAEALATAEAEVLESPRDVPSHELIIDISMNLGLGYRVEARYLAVAEAMGEQAWAWTLAGRAATTAVAARAAYERALRADPSYARAQTGLGDVDRAEGELASAEARYWAAIAQDPGLAEAYTSLGGLLLALDRQAEALATCRQALVAVPGDPEAYLAAAQLDAATAETTLRKGVRQVPNDTRLHAALGDELLEGGQLDEAAASYRRSLALDPHQPDLVSAAILVEEVADGRLEAGVRESLRRAKALTGTSPVAAVDLVNQLALRHPDSFLVHMARGYVLAETGDRPGAERSLRRALLIRPSDPDAQATLGLLLLSQGQGAEAWPLLDAARQERPRDVSVAISAAMARAQVQGPAAAAQDLAVTADRFPTDVRPVMALATLLNQLGNLEGAYTVLHRSVERFPHPTLLLAAAGAARDVGRDAEAATHLRTLADVTGEERWREAADDL